MDRGRGESGLTPRLFLVAPRGIAAGPLVDCLKAACQAGDVASLLLPASLASDTTAKVQTLGVAVIVDGEPRDALRSAADGMHIDAANESIADARAALGGDRIVGAFAGSSRHLAMEAAEAGADYVALSQSGASVGGVPVVAWWSSMMEIPCVAFEPVEPHDLDILLPQNPDFIRPSDAMWVDAEAARRIVTDLRQRLEAK